MRGNANHLGYLLICSAGYYQEGFSNQDQLKTNWLPSHWEHQGRLLRLNRIRRILWNLRDLWLSLIQFPNPHQNLDPSLIILCARVAIGFRARCNIFGNIVFCQSFFDQFEFWKIFKTLRTAVPGPASFCYRKRTNFESTRQQSGKLIQIPLWFSFLCIRLVDEEWLTHWWKMTKFEFL